jgi:hypothetical protein
LSRKTSLIEALVIPLTWLVKRIESEKGVGKAIDELRIRNDHAATSLKLRVYEHEVKTSYEWIVAKTRRGLKAMNSRCSRGSLTLPTFTEKG